MKFISPKVDYAFKRIFGSDQSQDILISFLNAIIYQGEKFIQSLTIVNPYNPGQIQTLKESYLDVKAVLSDGSITSYDATQTIIKALQESNSNYSRKQLQRTLSSPNFSVEGVTGKIRFWQLGDRQFSNNDKTALVQVKPNPISGKYLFVSLE